MPVGGHGRRQKTIHGQRMNIDAHSGRLDIARYIESPNCDDRPDSGDISLIVIHNISLPPGEFGGEGITRLFTNTLDPLEYPDCRELHGLRVSSHLLIRRNGGVIQFVPFHRRAWHAGISEYKGRTRCNDFSIGIELEGADDIPYEEDQYAVLAAILGLLCKTYTGIHPHNIAGHSDIAAGRKTDPGAAFDWSRIEPGRLV